MQRDALQCEDKLKGHFVHIYYIVITHLHTFTSVHNPTTDRPSSSLSAGLHLLLSLSDNLLTCLKSAVTDDTEGMVYTAHLPT